MTLKSSIPSIAEIKDLDRKTRTIILNDQRNLSFNIYGAENGQPIIYFHGGPSSRLEGALSHRIAIERNYQIICPDRPGHGHSDPKPGYTILDLADDVLELADHLGLDHFGVMGMSGGGPPVISCANKLKDRLDSAVSLGGAAPIYTDPVASQSLSALDRITAGLAARLPRALFIPFMGLMIGTFRNINTKDRYKKVFGSLLCEADLKIVESIPDFVPVMMYSILEAYRGGAAGPADDTVAIVTDWGFSLNDIEFPVVIVHGTEDKHVPFSFAQYLHDQMPTSKMIPLQGEGHYVHLINVARTFDILEGQYSDRKPL